MPVLPTKSVLVLLQGVVSWKGRLGSHVLKKNMDLFLMRFNNVDSTNPLKGTPPQLMAIKPLLVVVGGYCGESPWGAKTLWRSNLAPEQGNNWLLDGQ